MGGQSILKLSSKLKPMSATASNTTQQSGGGRAVYRRTAVLELVGYILAGLFIFQLKRRLQYNNHQGSSAILLLLASDRLRPYPNRPPTIFFR